MTKWAMHMTKIQKINIDLTLRMKKRKRALTLSSLTQINMESMPTISEVLAMKRTSLSLLR